VWPFTTRLSWGALATAPEWRMLVLVGSQVTVLGAAALLASLVLPAWRRLLFGGALALLVIGTAVTLPPLAIDAYPTTYARPTVPYTAASIAARSQPDPSIANRQDAIAVLKLYIEDQRLRTPEWMARYQG